MPGTTRQLGKATTGNDLLGGFGAMKMFHIFISSAGATSQQGRVDQVVPRFTAKRGVPALGGATLKISLCRTPRTIFFYQTKGDDMIITSGYSVTKPSLKSALLL